MLNFDFVDLAGEAWRNLDDNEKKPFEKLAQKEQEKYETALGEWRKVSGQIRYIFVMLEIDAVRFQMVRSAIVLC